MPPIPSIILLNCILCFQFNIKCHSEPCREVRAVVDQRVEVEAVRAAVELHAAILEVVRDQLIAGAEAEARRLLTNTDSTSETLVNIITSYSLNKNYVYFCLKSILDYKSLG